jgi:rod shape determining protein RodA
VIGEELGLVGCLFILALYFLLLWRVIRIMQVSRDQFGCLLAAGVFSMMSFHVLVNVGMTLGVMPITGIPLPFVSFGGNSLLTNAVGLGLLESIAMRRQKIMF